MPGLRIDPFRGAFVTLCPAELIRFDLEHRVQRVLDARPDRLVNVALELPFVNLDRALQSPWWFRRSWWPPYRSGHGSLALAIQPDRGHRLKSAKETLRYRRRRGRLGNTWHLDALFVTIRGRRHYLWRAVDQDGDVIDLLVQSRRDRRAASRFFRKAVERARPRQPNATTGATDAEVKSAWHAQRFLSVHGLVQNLFRVGRHLLRAVQHRSQRTRSFRV